MVCWLMLHPLAVKQHVLLRTVQTVKMGSINIVITAKLDSIVILPGLNVYNVQFLIVLHAHQLLVSHANLVTS